MSCENTLSGFAANRIMKTLQELRAMEINRKGLRHEMIHWDPVQEYYKGTNKFDQPNLVK